MRYVLYARKSSESEDRQVQSIEDQVKVLRQVANQRRLLVIEEITESKSAKDPGNRPEFDRMLKQIERQKADGILCWNVNRLTRNPIDSGKLCWMLQRGVLKSILTPERTYLPEDNVLLFSVETGMANQFILDLKKSIQRGTESRLEKGWFPHRAPEGYLNNLREHTIEVDPERFGLVQRAWRLLLAGTHTVQQVIDTMNEEWGYRTRSAGKHSSKKINTSTGYRIFSNRFYSGYFLHAGVLYKGKHPPMITVEEFQQVQQQIHGQTGRPHLHKNRFAYVGFIRCARCGHMITAELNLGHLKRGHYIYYHCNNLDKTCSKRSIREDVLERRIDSYLQQITIIPEFKEIVMDKLEKWIKKEFADQETVYNQQLHTLSETERMLNELFEMRLRQLVEDEMFRAKQTELQTRRNDLILAVEKSQHRLERTREVVSNAMDFRIHAREHFLMGNLEKKREIAKALGLRYVLDEGTVYMESNPLFAPVLPIIEPSKQGDLNSKSEHSGPTFSFGAANGKDSEKLFADNIWGEAFRQVAEGTFYFPSYDWIVASPTDLSISVA